MRRLICTFVVCIWHKQVLSWRSSYVKEVIWVRQTLHVMNRDQGGINLSNIYRHLLSTRNQPCGNHNKFCDIIVWRRFSITSSPKGNNRSPESNVPRSIKQVLKKTDLLIIHNPNLKSSHFKKTWMRHGNQRLKSNSSWVFKPVLVTSNFDDDSIKNEWASMETPFSHNQSMRNFLDLKSS